MDNKLQKQITSLKIAVIALIAVNGFILFSSFEERGKKKKFEEIDAERINIMGTNGLPVLVLSNKRLMPGVMMQGKSYPKEWSDGRENYSGMIFFNEQGDEVGGLVYNGFPKGDTSHFAIEHLSFDQWKHNQVVAMQYIDNGKTKRAGLRVWDRPSNVNFKDFWDRAEARSKVPKNSPAYDSISKVIKAAADRGENGIERMFIGSLNEEAQIQLKDKKGNIRARFFVDKDGEAKIEFLDEKGKAIFSLPH